MTAAIDAWRAADAAPGEQKAITGGRIAR
jgi:hypothetical protein